MVMIRKDDKAKKISKIVLAQKGVQQPKASKVKKDLLQGPYLQH